MGAQPGGNGNHRDTLHGRQRLLIAYEAAAVGLQPGTGWPMYFLMLARCFWMILRAGHGGSRQTVSDTELLPCNSGGFCHSGPR